ncbi:MAG: hypothetical protein KC944_10665 [Candidatus Omnitrophica bacterium]|nr:hypothetical protein [Candidatus Omnitrophota bacterium]MCA9443192.1 hypothetical protein [Candidatus Omnitrophota bacterium]
MTRSRALATLCLSLFFLSLLSPKVSWGVHAPESKRHAFLNQGFGPSPLGAVQKSFNSNISAEVQADLDRLLAQKSNQALSYTLSSKSGLAHSVAHLKMKVPGANLEGKARAFLEDYSGLFLKGQSSENLVFEKIREDHFGSKHVDFLQYHQGLRVYGAGVTVHFDPDDNLVMVNGEFSPDIAIKASDAKAAPLSEGEALQKALRRLGPFPWRPVESGELVVYSKYPSKGGNYLAYRYELLGNGIGSHHILFVDAADGGVLAFFPTATYFDGTATVYDPNPAQSGLVQRTITDLDDSGLLRGPLNVVVDEENPRVQSANRNFNLDPGGEQFNQTSVYYYLTETRKKMRSLGFDDTSAGVLPVVTNAKDQQTGGEFNNAFFTPLSKGFVFGNGDGNVFQNLSRDFDVATHEFGHFFDDFLINTESTAPHTPRRAWGEAAGDTLAALVHGDPNVGESTIPGKSFLRTVDNTKRFPNDLMNEEHLDGEIFGGSNWDFMELTGGGSATQSARDEMARVMMAGIPHIPPANVQFSDILSAFVQGDMNRGGANVNNLRTAYNMHGITEGGIQKMLKEKIDTEEAPPSNPKQSTGYQEIYDGVPVTGTLFEGFYADFYIRIPAGTTKLTAQTFVPGFFQQGDVVLYVAPSTFTGPGEVLFSDSDYIPETIEVPNPLARDSVWLIEVADFIDGFYSEVGLIVTLEGAGGQITQIFLNTPINGRIDPADEQDIYYFQGTANQIVDISVTKRGDNTLDPLVALGNSFGNLLAYDDDNGGDNNARISGFTLPANDNYLIDVQSAFTDFGPTSLGDYTLLVSTGVAPGPTPTPIPTVVPGNAIPIADGVPVTGSIAASNPQAGAISQSNAYVITVPEGAEELVIETGEDPSPAGSLILQVRKNQPVGNTLDDYVGLGSRKSTVIVTPDSRVPLTAASYFILIFNRSTSPVNFQLVARIGRDGGGGMSGQFDADSNGVIDAVDLIAFVKGQPTDLNQLFAIASVWMENVP